jgi:hypothetical protein
MEFNLEKAVEYYEREQSITEAAKKVCKDLGIPYEEKYRHRVSRFVNSDKYTPEDSLSVTTSERKDETDYSYSHVDDPKPESMNMPSAWAPELDRFYTIEEYCDRYGLDHTKVKNSRLISHIQGHMIYNIGFYNPEEEAVIDLQKDLEEIVAKHSIAKDYEFNPSQDSTNIVTNLTITDVHVGMDPNKKGNSLFGGKWDRLELISRVDDIVDKTVKKSRKEGSEVLYVRDLGDLADGLDEQTTRGGHRLPQNMSNTEVFDVALEFKLLILDRLIQSGTYRKIYFHNVCNSNHGGDFDYFINQCFKGIAEERYGTDYVEVINHKKFIEHYGVGDHCFMLSHGKDDEDVKFGFKVQLDHKGASKIDGYLKANDLYRQYKYFHFCKGDSHQFLFDFTTSEDFNFLNYPALSPSSKWVQANFKRGFSGFVVETFNPNEPELDFSYKSFIWKF